MSRAAVRLTVQPPDAPSGEHAIRRGHGMKFRRTSLADRNAIVFVVARALSLLVPLLSFPVLGRALGPQGVGLIAYAQAFIQYGAVVVDFGFQYVTIATVAQCRDDLTALRRLFWSVSLFRAVLFVPCVLLSVPIALWLGQSFEEREVILMSLMLLTGVLLTPVWLYQGLERGVTFAVLALTPRLLVIPALWLLIDRPEHVERAAMILFGAELASGLLLFVYAWRRLVPGPVLADWATAKQEAGRAFDAWIGSAISISVAYATPLALREFAGLGMVGLYSAADRLVRAMHSFLYPVVQAYQPQATRLWETDPPAARRLMRKVGVTVVLAASAFFVAMQFFAEPLLLLVFGPQFEAAVPVLRWAAAFPILSATSCLILHLLYYAKRGSHSVRRVYLAVAVVHLALLYPLIHAHGAVGAVLTVSIAEGTLVAILWWRSRQWWKSGG